MNMTKIRLNENFGRLERNYLFADVAKRISETAARRGRRIIRLDVGDVTRPLAPCVVDAVKRAADEMGRAETFRGYCPDGGYPFLCEAVSRRYAALGAKVHPDEVFISDGSKSDAAALTALFGDTPVYIPDPVYPAYLDTNIIAGNRVGFLYSGRDTGFLPVPDACPDVPAVIYLCSPGNPTGAAFDPAGLAAWVAHAQRTGSLLIWDAAYAAFAGEGKPRTIYSVKGAREVAVELCSLSKSAGFTGTRCAWSVFPHELGELRKNWIRKRAASFNGVAYVIQRAAEAALSPEGTGTAAGDISIYKENARIISDVLRKKGIFHTGADDSPYVWAECPGTDDSREFFGRMLDETGVAGTPGAGFGKNGEGWFRFSAFAAREDVLEAADRLDRWL